MIVNPGENRYTMGSWQSSHPSSAEGAAMAKKANMMTAKNATAAGGTVSP
jgi:hypothetical protein